MTALWLPGVLHDRRVHHGRSVRGVLAPVLRVGSRRIMGDARDALGGPRKSSLLKASTSLSELSPRRYRLSRLKTPHSFKMSVFPKLIIMIPIKMPVGFFFFEVGVCVKNKLQDLSGNAESLKDY